MSDEENVLFDNAVQAMKLGRRLPDAAPERANEYFSQSKQDADRFIDSFRLSVAKEKRSFPRVIVDYVDSWDPNAIAFREDEGFYVIAINKGLLIGTEFLFNRLFCNPQFLPNFRVAEHCPRNYPDVSLANGIQALREGIGRGEYTVASFEPIDPIRKAAAQIMTFTAIQFLMGHEFRHIQAGHVDYAQKKFQLSSIQERTVYNSISIDSNMKLQSLEMDADRYALHAILGDHCKSWESPGPKTLAQTILFEMHHNFTLMLVIACTAPFKLLDSYKPSVSEWLSIDHPPPLLRRLSLVSTAINFLSLTNRQNLSELLTKDIANYVDVLEKFCDTIWGVPIDAAYTLTIMREEGFRHKMNIMDVWDSITGDLKKYSYVDFPVTGYY